MPKVDSTLIFIPHTGPYVNIEYRLRNKGGSAPFSRIRAVGISEQKDKGEDFVRTFVGCLFEKKNKDIVICVGEKFHTYYK